MAVVGTVPHEAVDVQDKDMPPRVREGWRNLFVSLQRVCDALTQSGTTANRPTKFLWPGRMYFDFSLGANGKPIWVNKTSTGWVLADGTAA